VPAREATVAGLGRTVERFAQGPRAVPAVFATALVVYGIVSVALPLAAGRDLARYLQVYTQLVGGQVVFPNVVLTRTPGTPLVAGVLLEAGPIASEVCMAILYALSIVAWFSVARRFGGLAAAGTAVALLAYPGYVMLFHELASDALFAAAFALVALLLVQASERPTAARAAVLGVGVAILVSVRPVGQALVLLGVVPLLAARGRRPRLLAAAGFAAGVLVPLLGIAVHNAVRADDFTVVRGSSASLLFRTFVVDRIVQPDNGPASAELGRVVERELLPNEPYRSRRIDLETFFSSGSPRMQDDLLVLADRTWGWDDGYRHLGRVAREAIRTHPSAYAQGVRRDLWRLVLWPLYAPVASSSSPPPAPAVASSGAAPRAVPATDEEPIPSSRESPSISTPDGRIREVWTSPNDHSIVFRYPRDAVRAAAIDRKVDRLLGRLPDREQRPGLVRLLNDLSRLYPRPFMWLLVGMAAAVWRRPKGIAVPAALSAAAFLLLVSTSLAVYAVAQYAVPVVPAFVVLATTGLLGRRAV
jgi:hypothetical protein